MSVVPNCAPFRQKSLGDCTRPLLPTRGSRREGGCDSGEGGDVCQGTARRSSQEGEDSRTGNPWTRGVRREGYAYYATQEKKRRTLGWMVPCTAEQFESRVLAPLSQSKKIAQPLSCRLAPNLFIPRGEHLMSDPGPYRRWRAWRPALERRRRRPWRSPPPMDRGGDRFDGSDRGDRPPMDRGGFGDRGGAAAFAFTFWPRWPWIG